MSFVAMDTLLFVSFLATSLLISVTPGPSVALASSQAVRFGPKAAAVSVAGDALGTVIHILIAVASLQTLNAISDWILPYLQLAGGFFILYLAWLSLRRVNNTDALLGNTVAIPRATFFAGFFTCVTNPKAVVFFVALFPGFISADHSVAMQSLIYGAVFVVSDAAIMFGYALVAMYAFRKVFFGRFSIERLSGFGLLGVGAFLILKGYKALPSD